MERRRPRGGAAIGRATRWPLRWLAVFLGASLGSWAGRLAAAALYHEPVAPLLRVKPWTLLSQDVAPGFLATELFGRGQRAGLAGEVFIAAVGAAISAMATGPLLRDQPRAGSDAVRGTIGRAAG